MDILLGAIIEVFLGAAIALMFSNRSTSPRARAIGLRISTYVIMVIVVLVPSIAFLALGQLLGMLFFEIPDIEAKMKDGVNG